MIPALGLALLLAAAQPPAEAAADPAPGDAISDVLLKAPAQDGPAPGDAPAKPAPIELDPHTKVDGAVLQVILGERAVVTLDEKGGPVLASSDKGRLSAAHPRGTVTELFFPPAKGQFAVALDGSAEVRASVVKVWNSLDRPVEIRMVGLVLDGDKLTPAPMGLCPFAPGEVRAQSWPAPIVAIAVSGFSAPSAEALAAPACARKGN